MTRGGMTRKQWALWLLFGGPIAVGPADIYVVADIFWYFLHDYERMIAKVRDRLTTTPRAVCASRTRSVG